MSDPEPELSRPIPISRLGVGLDITVEAREDERAALARRMGLEAIHALTCHFDLQPLEAARIAALGKLRARVRQLCVLSLEPFDADIAEDFRIVFVPDGSASGDFDPDADDELPYDGRMIDIGEAASEQLALALDPFPRRPGSTMPDVEASRNEGPFAGLLGQLGGK